MSLTGLPVIYLCSHKVWSSGDLFRPYAGRLPNSLGRANGKPPPWSLVAAFRFRRSSDLQLSAWQCCGLSAWIRSTLPVRGTADKLLGQGGEREDRRGPVFDAAQASLATADGT